MSYSSEVLADSPLAYYRLNEASGTTMADASGNAHDGGYINGPTLGATGLLVGSSDAAVLFPGSSAFAITPANASNAAFLDGLGAVTVEAIIKPSSPTGHIISRDDVGGGGRSFQFGLTSGKLNFVKIAGGIVQVTSTATLSVGSTYHVAATYDGSTIRLYVNGVLDNSAAATGSLGTVSCALRIAARRSTVTTDFFNGVIDEVAVYGTALSPTRIAAHHTAAITSGVTGSLDLTFPAFGLDLEGRVQPDLDLTFPPFRMALSGTVATAGQLDLSFPPFDLDLQGSRPDVAAGTLAMSFPAFRFTFAAEAEDAISTVTLYDLDGRVRDGMGLVSTDVAVAVPPAGLSRAQRVTKAIAYPTPTLADGRPT